MAREVKMECMVAGYFDPMLTILNLGQRRLQYNVAQYEYG